MIFIEKFDHSAKFGPEFDTYGLNPHNSSSAVLLSRYAFSKNGQPTMLPYPNSNVAFGEASEMSQNDIARLNRLYKCCKYYGIKCEISGLQFFQCCL